MKYELEPNDVSRALTSRGIRRGAKRDKEYKGRDVDARRSDGSLPDFLWERRDARFYYDAEAIDWLVFMRSVKDTDHAAATYANMKLIFEAAIVLWGTDDVLEKLKACFEEDNFKKFLRCLLDAGVVLPEDIVRYAAEKPSDPES